MNRAVDQAIKKQVNEVMGNIKESKIRIGQSYGKVVSEHQILEMKNQAINQVEQLVDSMMVGSE